MFAGQAAPAPAPGIGDRVDEISNQRSPLRFDREGLATERDDAAVAPLLFAIDHRAFPGRVALRMVEPLLMRTHHDERRFRRAASSSSCCAVAPETRHGGFEPEPSEYCKAAPRVPGGCRSACRQATA